MIKCFTTDIRVTNYYATTENGYNNKSGISNAILYYVLLLGIESTDDEFNSR